MTELAQCKACGTCVDTGDVCAKCAADIVAGQLWQSGRGAYSRGPTGGVKHDAAKLRYDLIPPEALDAVAAVLGYGAAKYGVRNWERGMSWGRVFGASMRHLWAWWRGEETDSESGLSHLAHAACGVCFLLAYSARKAGTDDRR